MIESPLVSVGILSYNRADELRVAIDSILAQTYTNLEIIISDNASTKPEVIEVIREYAARDPRIRPVYHVENRGVHFNLQFVADEARGEFFCWLASDDAYGPDFVATCVSELQQHPGAVMAACEPYYLQTGKPVAMKHMPHTLGLSLEEKYLRIVAHMYEDPNLFYYSLFRTEAVQKTRLHYKKLFAGDTLLILELVEAGDFVVNRSVPGLLYNMHEGQISSSILRYKGVLMPYATSFVERRGFFTAHAGFMAQIVWRNKHLSLGQRLKIVQKIITGFFSSGRYHLLKYDLGISGLMQGLKRASGKK